MTQAEYEAHVAAKRERQRKNMLAFKERERNETPPPPSRRYDVPGEWIDDDGIVLPQWREEVARRRALTRVQMQPIGWVMHQAQTRKDWS